MFHFVIRAGDKMERLRTEKVARKNNVGKGKCFQIFPNNIEIDGRWERNEK